MLDSVQRVLHYAVPTDVKMHLQMVLLDSVQCVLHYAVPTDVRIHWRIVIRNIIVQLSTFNLLCRTYKCKKKLADGEATLCSDCQLKRDLARIAYYYSKRGSYY